MAKQRLPLSSAKHRWLFSGSCVLQKLMFRWQAQTVSPTRLPPPFGNSAFALLSERRAPHLKASRHLLPLIVCSLWAACPLPRTLEIYPKFGSRYAADICSAPSFRQRLNAHVETFTEEDKEDCLNIVKQVRSSVHVEL